MAGELDLFALWLRPYARHPARFVAISAASLLITIPVAFVPDVWYRLVQPVDIIAGEIMVGALDGRDSDGRALGLLAG